MTKKKFITFVSAPHPVGTTTITPGKDYWEIHRILSPEEKLADLLDTYNQEHNPRVKFEKCRFFEETENGNLEDTLTRSRLESDSALRNIVIDYAHNLVCEQMVNEGYLERYGKQGYNARKMGVAPELWARMQSYLKEHYGIKWKSPRDTSPERFFD